MGHWPDLSDLSHLSERLTLFRANLEMSLSNWTTIITKRIFEDEEKTNERRGANMNDNEVTAKGEHTNMIKVQVGGV